MSYVRRKRIDGIEYFYLVEGKKIDDKVKQRVIAYLGKHKTVGAAYLHWVRESRKPGRKLYAKKMMKVLAPHIEEE